MEINCTIGGTDMKIDFFETDKGMDLRAVKGGIYQVELIMENKIPICLYIGESVWIASRCGEHLYSVWENPEYFGLEKDDLNNDNLTLKFSVIDEIKGRKSELGVGLYKEQELEEIKKRNPVTQLNTSDRQIKDISVKKAKVQNKMKENGFK